MKLSELIELLQDVAKRQQNDPVVLLAVERSKRETIHASLNEVHTWVPGTVHAWVELTN